MNTTAIAAAAIAATATATAANAAFSTQNNATVSFAGADLDAVVFGSSGIPNSNFEVATNTDEGLEVAIKAIERFQPPDLPTAGTNNDRYIAPIGEGDPGLALWNYVTAVDLGQRTIADFDIQFDIDFDPAFGATNFVSIDVDATASAAGQAGLSRFGDSQNLGFPFWQAAPFFAPLPFGPNTIGEYDFVLTVFEKGTTNVLAQSDIAVVVPTPGAASLAALAAIAATRRRR